MFFARVVYDLLFFFIVIVIILNLIFGVIIDTFVDLRSEKQQKELILKHTYFICGKCLLESIYCIFLFPLYTIRDIIYHTISLKHYKSFTGLNRSAFDNKTVSFEEHIKKKHNMWHYLYFIVLVKVKDPTEFTGPESYVYMMVKVIVHRA